MIGCVFNYQILKKNLIIEHKSTLGESMEMGFNHQNPEILTVESQSINIEFTEAVMKWELFLSTTFSSSRFSFSGASEM